MRVRLGFGQGSAQRGQREAQCRAAARGVAFWPEQSGELLARVQPRLQDHVRQDGQGLARREGNVLAGVPDSGRAEQRERESSYLALLLTVFSRAESTVAPGRRQRQPTSLAKKELLQ